ncbi:MAG: hypothetical protein V4677_07505 [Bacteroidota bacterium]
MKEFIEVIRDKSLILLTDFSPERREKAIRAYQRYNENLLRLEKRFNEYIQIETKKAMVDLEELEKQNRTLEDLQLEFVDKTEAFHQHVYATISTFILLLSHVAGHKYKGQLPISGVTKFLKYISETNQDEYIDVQADALKTSIDFRAKFIDHPQQHALHDWMTWSHGSGTCIIYFIRTGNGVYVPEHIDPYACDFRPPIDCGDFYVSPPPHEAFLAIKGFSVAILDNLIKE